MAITERVSATSYVVDSVRRWIQNGKLKVGDRLPREADMAKELGVGRSTLREAVKILNAYGVIESRQGEGTFVVDKSAQTCLKFLGFFPGSDNDTNYIELRRVLETGSIYTIYDKVDSKKLDELEKYVSIMNEKHSIDEYVAADVAFHQELIAYTQNPLIIQINEMLIDLRMDLLNRIFCYREVVDDAYVEHKRIIEALRSKELIACLEAVNYHLDKTTNTVNQLFEESSNS